MAANWPGRPERLITLSSYHYRWRNAAGNPRHDPLESVQFAQSKITVPAVLLHGELDSASLPQSTAGEDDCFTGGYRRIVVPGTGHFVPREKPKPVVDAIPAQG